MKTGFVVALIAVSLAAGFLAGFFSGGLLVSEIPGSTTGLDSGNPLESIPRLLTPGEKIGEYQVSMMARYSSSKCIRVFLKGEKTAVVDVCSKTMEPLDEQELSKYMTIPLTYIGKIYDYSFSVIEGDSSIQDIVILENLMSHIED